MKGYLVGTPKGRLTRLERELLDKPWQEARPGVQAKLVPQDGELYVFAQSRDRVAKERALVGVPVPTPVQHPERDERVEEVACAGRADRPSAKCVNRTQLDRAQQGLRSPESKPELHDRVGRYVGDLVASMQFRLSASKASSASFSVEVEQLEQPHKPAIGAFKLELCFRSVQTSKPAWL